MKVQVGDFAQSPQGWSPQSTVLTLGNFDGLHCGHRFLLEEVKEKAVATRRQVAVLTFDPHPGRFFHGDKFPLPLQTSEHRRRRFSELGVDHLLIQRFDSSFAEISAEDFLRQYLLASLRPAQIVFGYDFHFGKGSLGDFQLAKSRLEPVGIEVTQAEAFRDQEGSLSSSRVRELLRRGEVRKAHELLGYAYQVQGSVVSGQKLGRQLGFPTANLKGVETLWPAQGVYVGWATSGDIRKRAVLNIGRRPTVESSSELHFEVHLLDFTGHLYGEVLTFEFVDRLREEKKFASLEDLRAQILLDLDKARSLL